jgi:hypothetical protein
MCKVAIIDYSVGGAYRGGQGSKKEWEGEGRKVRRRKAEKMEREEKENIGGEKGKWSNRRLRELAFEQNGKGDR